MQVSAVQKESERPRIEMTKAQVFWCLWSCLVSVVVCDFQVLSESTRLYHVDTVSELNNEVTSATALQLALDSIGCRSTFLPNQGISIQADVFHHPEAFLLILADSSKVNPLNSINANVRHTLPLTNAIEFQQIRSEIKEKCDNKATIVSSSVNSDLEASLWTQYSDLKRSDPNDVAFVRELTAVASLRTSIRRSDKAKKDIYIVSFTNLRTVSNLQVASNAIENQIAILFETLSTEYSTVGVQSMASDVQQPLSAVARRHLQDTNDTNATTTPTRGKRRAVLTLEDISNYQITLWIALSLILMVLITTCAMCNMNLGRDSLLYATFLTEASHRKVN